MRKLGMFLGVVLMISMVFGTGVWAEEETAIILLSATDSLSATQTIMQDIPQSVVQLMISGYCLFTDEPSFNGKINDLIASSTLTEEKSILLKTNLEDLRSSLVDDVVSKYNEKDEDVPMEDVRLEFASLFANQVMHFEPEQINLIIQAGYDWLVDKKQILEEQVRDIEETLAEYHAD